MPTTTQMIADYPEVLLNVLAELRGALLESASTRQQVIELLAAQITDPTSVQSAYQDVTDTLEEAKPAIEALLKEGFQPADVEAGLKLYGPKGCSNCTDGYKGRVGIYQVMAVTDAIGRIIMEGGNAISISDQAAKEGVWDLRRAGLEKVKQGMTSLEEVNSITVD